MNKNLTGWLTTEKPDVVCFQEIKAQPEQFDTFLFETMGYHTYWHPAVKKGYSGVAILSKQKPEHVETGCGNEGIDCEGRVIRADIGDLSFMSVYFPSGTTGGERQTFKMDFCAYMDNYIRELRKQRPNLVLSGDVNICHQPMDIHDPVRNAKSSGFLPEEREWMSNFLAAGMVDSFRYKNPNTVKYSWWFQMFNSRAKNKGWRIDYHLVSEALKDRITHADILNDAMHSDHCPVLLELD
jgi:exodeoxyribonuclease-3